MSKPLPYYGLLVVVLLALASFAIASNPVSAANSPNPIPTWPLPTTTVTVYPTRPPLPTNTPAPVPVYYYKFRDAGSTDVIRNFMQAVYAENGTIVSQVPTNGPNCVNGITFYYTLPFDMPPLTPVSVKP